jgi:hypothetical protein
MTALPVGPRVTLIALAAISTPSLIDFLASKPVLINLDIFYPFLIFCLITVE